MIIIPKFDISKATRVEEFAMFILAAFPVLDVYRFGTSHIGYASMMGIFLFIYGIISKKRFTYPITYIVFWIYCALQVIFIGGASTWQDLLPGGIQLFIFSICIAAFCKFFNYNCLHKWIIYIWLVAVTLFLIQFLVFLKTGQRLSMFLPLGNNLSYENFTYSELVHHQQSITSSERFSSIFLEPSYFGQFTLLAMVFEWFSPQNKNKLFTPLLLFMGAIILVLQSGVGILGAAILAIIKLIYLIIISRQRKYIVYLIVLIPLFILGIQHYLETSAGQYMLSRTDQLQYNRNSDLNSGFVRLYYGYIQFGNINFSEQFFGVSRVAAQAMRDKEGFYNGISFFLCNNGFLGLFLFICFLVANTRKKNVNIIALTVLFIGISAIESTYLSALMMITCVVISFPSCKNEIKNI